MAYINLEGENVTRTYIYEVKPAEAVKEFDDGYKIYQHFYDTKRPSRTGRIDYNTFCLKDETGKNTLELVVKNGVLFGCKKVGQEAKGVNDPKYFKYLEEFIDEKNLTLGTDIKIIGFQMNENGKLEPTEVEEIKEKPAIKEENKIVTTLKDGWEAVEILDELEKSRLYGRTRTFEFRDDNGETQAAVSFQSSYIMKFTEPDNIKTIKDEKRIAMLAEFVKNNDCKLNGALGILEKDGNLYSLYNLPKDKEFTVEHLNFEHKKIPDLSNVVVTNTFFASHCDLDSFKNFPKSVKNLNISSNNFKSLEGMPKGVETLNVACNRLESLEHLTESVKNLDISRNPFFKELHIPKTLESVTFSGDNFEKFGDSKNFTIAKDSNIKFNSDALYRIETEKNRDNIIAAKKRGVSSSRKDKINALFNRITGKETEKGNIKKSGDKELTPAQKTAIDSKKRGY